VLMNVVDIIIAIGLAFGFFKGFSKGFIVEIASLFALFLGLFGALKFSPLVVVLIEGYFDWNPDAIQASTYFLVFIIIVFGISLLAKALTKVISLAALGLFNRFLGALFGVIKWGVFLCVAFFFIGKLNNWITVVDPKYFEGSLLYEPILKLGEFLFNWGSGMSDEIPEKFI
jgi:membrane protein required for colicin V production